MTTVAGPGAGLYVVRMGTIPSAPAVSRRPADLVRGGLSAAVLGVTAAVVQREGTPAWERAAFRAAHQVPRYVDFIVWAPMQAGSAWGPPAAAWYVWRRHRSWRPTAGALVAGWGAWWAAKGVKALVRRGRPAAEMPEDVRDSAVREGLGFVSGHSAVAVACAGVLWAAEPPSARLAWYGLAGVVAGSRVVVGAHLPLDVVGGAALGQLLASSWQLAVGGEERARP